MAALATEMPTEALAGASTPASSQTSTTTTAGGGGGDSTAINNNTSIIDSTRSPPLEAVSNNSHNNTISAAADSSDNQPSPPQLHNHLEQNSLQNAINTSSNLHQFTNNNHIYTNTTTTDPTIAIRNAYAHHLQSPSNVQQNSPYSFMSSYEQFYMQHSIPPLTRGVNDNINTLQNMIFPSGDARDSLANGVRIKPRLSLANTITTCAPLIYANTYTSPQTTNPLVSNSSTSVMSPPVVSSSSPSSTGNQMHIVGGGSAASSSMSSGNPNSPNTPATVGGGSLQCKRCGLLTSNEAELQDHIQTTHGTSPYGSSGYASSPYIKEELQTPPHNQQQQHQQQQPPHTPLANMNANPGEILDLDSQKMLYPAQHMMHNTLANASTDPLHGLHSMQQRASGLTSWPQATQEAVPPPYLQQQTSALDSKISNNNHASFYEDESNKLSGYQVNSNSSTSHTTPINIKNEYPGADMPQFVVDKSFDPTASQQMLPPPATAASPAEFPSTTTGAADNQQFCANGNFESPSSSSANVTTGGPLGTKAANWKSNEARRPKTYHCTACNKWFTSSGHLKRHYNTTLHKNAVKSSGQPDPATLPISQHHHPARDPVTKTGRGRGANNASNQQSNQQPPQPTPIPLKPPEPPNSPQNYYPVTQTPCNNVRYQPYTPQQPQQPLQQQQQKSLLNGHPNALAGLSAPPTRQQQVLMPSSPMRGLLNNNNNNDILTNNMMLITKIEHLEEAQPMVVEQQEMEEEDYHQQQQLQYGMNVQTKVQEGYSREIMFMSKLEVVTEDRELQDIQHQYHQMKAVWDTSTAAKVEEHHHNSNSQLPTTAHCQLDSLIYHNSSNSNISTHPLIISHQQPQQQIMARGIYTLMPPLQQQQQSNIQEQQPQQEEYISIPPLDINNMQQSQLPATTITMPTTNMVNMLPPLNHHTELQLPPPQLHNMSQLEATTNTITHTALLNNTIHTHIPTPTNNMQSYQQMLAAHLGSVVTQAAEHTVTIPHTIIGNAPIQQQHFGGQLMQFIPDNGYSPPPDNLPPNQMLSDQLLRLSLEQTTVLPPSNMLTPPSVHSSNSASSPDLDKQHELTGEYINKHFPTEEKSSSEEVKPTVHQTSRSQRKRKASNSSSNSSLPSYGQIIDGCIQCTKCEREFTNSSYLTQHYNAQHNGESKHLCVKCGKKFRTPEALEIHIPLHNEHKFSCKFCPRGYAHKHDLKRHEKSHTQTTQHVCSVCSKNFERNDQLQKHKRTHEPKIKNKRQQRNSPKTKTNTKINLNRNSKDLSNTNVIKQEYFSPTISSASVSPAQFIESEINISVNSNVVHSPVMQPFENSPTENF